MDGIRFVAVNLGLFKDSRYYGEARKCANETTKFKRYDRTSIELS